MQAGLCSSVEALWFQVEEGKGQKWGFHIVSMTGGAQEQVTHIWTKEWSVCVIVSV